MTRPVTSSIDPISPTRLVGDPFKDHLLAVLSLHDAPRAAAAPVPRYSSPRDWQTDAILRKVEALMPMLVWPSDSVYLDIFSLAAAANARSAGRIFRYNMAIGIMYEFTRDPLKAQMLAKKTEA
ncbi:hypothetical protein B0H13DRAFT_2333745 [Mycena leptocephala]|nr:hypothetical protein B0H13DRAFT_2333745 [Mycena leptocephala]